MHASADGTPHRARGGPTSFEPQLRPRLAYPEAEAADMLGLSPRTLFNIRQEGRIGFVREGQRVVYPLRAIRQYLRENETREAASTQTGTTSAGGCRR